MSKILLPNGKNTVLFLVRNSKKVFRCVAEQNVVKLSCFCCQIPKLVRCAVEQNTVDFSAKRQKPRQTKIRAVLLFAIQKILIARQTKIQRFLAIQKENLRAAEQNAVKLSCLIPKTFAAAVKQNPNTLDLRLLMITGEEVSDKESTVCVFMY
jgi:hypothetical protein